MTWNLVFRLGSKLPEGRGSVLSLVFFPKASVEAGMEYVIQVLAEWANNHKQSTPQPRSEGLGFSYVEEAFCLYVHGLLRVVTEMKDVRVEDHHRLPNSSNDKGLSELWWQFLARHTLRGANSSGNGIIPEQWLLPYDNL